MATRSSDPFGWTTRRRARVVLHRVMLAIGVVASGLVLVWVLCVCVWCDDGRRAFRESLLGD